MPLDEGKWLSTLVVLACGLALAGCADRGRPREVLELDRPNILLLVAEDMSPRVGVYGDELADTPNIDGLAKGGLFFTRAFTTSGVCATSRAALMTGMPQNAVGAGHMRVSMRGPFPYAAVPPPEVKAFPELLRRAGYWTFNDGKTDYQFSTSSMGGSGPRTIWDRDSFLGGHDWRDAPPDRPFFGMINFGTTHESGLFPFGWPSNAIHAVMQVAWLWRSWGVEYTTDPASVPLPPFYPDIPSARQAVAWQYDHVRAMDARVGAVLARLEEDGLADSTIVVWTTDHGSGLPGYKREITDRGLHVPLVIRWPERWRPAGVAPGDVDTRLVSFVDLAPQILAWAGVAQPKWMTGRVFVGPGAGPERRYIYAARDRLDEITDRGRSVRDERFLYSRNSFPGLAGALPLGFRETVPLMADWRRLYEEGKLGPTQAAWFEPRGAEELYDARADPHMVRNLAGDSAYAGELERMREALDSWLESHDDQGQIDEELLAERFWPGGEQPETPPPSCRLAGSALEIVSPVPGASIAWRSLASSDQPDWNLYTVPVSLAPGEAVEALAVRYGWSESEIVECAPRGQPAE